MSNLKIFTENIEPEALNQVYTLIKQPAFADCKVRIMPDVHAGAGCVIGFTADLGEKVIPNIVGVDIGCGMLTVELGNIDLDLATVDQIIRAKVPSGRNVHEGRPFAFDRLKELRCYRELKDTKRLERSIGTLGGGNHFIEVDVDEDGTKYLIIHTGSRNLGKQVAEYYQNLAIEIMQGKDELYAKQEQLIAEYKAQGRRKEIQKAIKELHRKFNPNPLNIPKDLCYLTGKYREDYLHDMEICQHFASLNRYHIANTIVGDLFGADIAYWKLPMFETIHNYIEFGTNMVRKGAISAKAGEPLLIPINMRDGCILGKGKGNDDWNCSAPHGAGRIMSRSKAKELVSLKEFEDSMQGIFTTSVGQSTIDEAPMVYKPMAEIVENIADTVEIVKIIQPIYNFKASE
nr:MAG TPA: tRNA-splicing ligase RtcB [Caudoviricetes sp.]